MGFFPVGTRRPGITFVSTGNCPLHFVLAITPGRGAPNCFHHDISPRNHNTSPNLLQTSPPTSGESRGPACAGVRIQHDATLSLPGLEKHGRSRHPPCCPSPATDTRGQTALAPHPLDTGVQHKQPRSPCVHRTAGHTSTHDSRAGRGPGKGRQPPTHTSPASSCSSPLPPHLPLLSTELQVLPSLGLQHRLNQLIPPYPQFPQDTSKIPYVGREVYSSCLDPEGCAGEAGLERSAEDLNS